MNKKREERQAKYPWYSQNDPVKEQLKSLYPWLDKAYVADVTRKPNVDAWKDIRKDNCPDCKCPLTSPYCMTVTCTCNK